MKSLLLLTLAILPLSGIAQAAPKVGQAAPDFTATDTKGDLFKLSDLKGKNVVLEWTNHECPYVKKHYGTGNMQELQGEATKDGAIWVSIVSSAKDKEGHLTEDQANKIITEEKALPTHKILDESGSIGKMYGAKTTPHMFVINKEGVIAYAGAIDDNSSSDPDDVKTAKNYVRAALENLKAGKPVTTASTKPYGCSVKY